MDKIIDSIINKSVGYDTETTIGEASRFDFEFEDTSVTKSYFKRVSNLGISLGRDGRFGYSSGNPQKWENCLKSAKDVHKSSAKIPYFGIQKKLKLNQFNLDFLKDIDLEKEVKDINYLIKKYKKDFHVKTSFTLVNKKIIFKNSNEQHYSFKGDTLGLSVYIHKNKTQGYDWCMSLNKFNYEDIFKNAVKNFEMAKEVKRIKPGKYNMVFNYEACSSMFAALLPSFLGTRKQDKTSPLGDRLGESVFDTKLTITDDGLTKDYLGSSPSDAEGTPSQKNVLVKNGKIKNFLYDYNSACRESLKSTGNCGSFGIKPSVSWRNIVIENGDGFKIKNGEILVQSLVGTHMLNNMTGDFTLQVEGFYFDRGKYWRAKDIMISGNIFQMFKDIELDNKSINKGSFLVSPKIKFKNVQVIS